MADTRKRMEVRIPDGMFDQVKHFSDQQDVPINEFMLRSIDHYIKYILSDYNLPSAEIKRLNQLVDNMHGLNLRMHSLEQSVNNGFEGLNHVMNNDNYLDDRGDE